MRQNAAAGEKEVTKKFRGEKQGREYLKEKEGQERESKRKMRKKTRQTGDERVEINENTLNGGKETRKGKRENVELPNEDGEREQCHE